MLHGLQLARLTNRTLVVPPLLELGDVFIGSPDHCRRPESHYHVALKALAWYVKRMNQPFEAIFRLPEGAVSWKPDASIRPQLPQDFDGSIVPAICGWEDASRTRGSNRWWHSLAQRTQSIVMVGSLFYGHAQLAKATSFRPRLPRWSRQLELSRSIFGPAEGRGAFDCVQARLKGCDQCYIKHTSCGAHSCTSRPAVREQLKRLRVGTRSVYLASNANTDELCAAIRKSGDANANAKCFSARELQHTVPSSLTKSLRELVLDLYACSEAAKAFHVFEGTGESTFWIILQALRKESAFAAAASKVQRSHLHSPSTMKKLPLNTKS